MEIPMTSFLDFVLKSGSPKMTCAQIIKKHLAEKYDPKTDYYKKFRAGVQKLHQEGKDKSELAALIGTVSDNKRKNYRDMIAGYKSFLGKKDVDWFEPPRKVWKHGGLQIPINPEVGLEYNGTKHVIKLYLKAEKPSKDRFSSILALMKTTLPKDYAFCLLDVRNATLYSYESSMLTLIPLVEGEADSLETILKKI